MIVTLKLFGPFWLLFGVGVCKIFLGLIFIKTNNFYVLSTALFYLLHNCLGEWVDVRMFCLARKNFLSLIFGWMNSFAVLLFLHSRQYKKKG